MDLSQRLEADGLGQESWAEPAREREREAGAGAAQARSPGSAYRDRRAECLARVIEAEIIPRLMMVHNAPRGAATLPAVDVSAPGPDLVAEFADLILANNVDSVAARVQGLRDRGMRLESVYLDLLAPTAKHLGALWEADQCDFTTVTLGLWRLQELMHRLSSSFQIEPPATRKRPPGQRFRALLIPAPGEQHRFGILMVSEFFRRACWEVEGDPPATEEQLISTVRNQWFDIAGLSVSGDLRIDALKSAVAAVRKSSCNPNVGIMVGGQIFLQRPELVAQVGADLTAADGREAVTRAERLVATLGQIQRI